MPDVPLWPQCNIGCVFCSNPVEGFRNTTAMYTYDEFKDKWEKFKRGDRTFLKFDGVRDYFNLTGGEPTLHPDFLKILALIRTDFPGKRIKLLSNGRMFAYEDFARRTLGIGQTPFEVALPIFGYNPPTHESISRTQGSFDQTIEGMRNIFKHRRAGQKVEVRVILTKIQMKTVGGILDFLAKEFPEIDSLDPIKVTWMEACDSCHYRPNCVGVHKSYFNNTGAKDIAAIAGPVPGVELSGDWYHPIRGIEKPEGAAR